MPTTITKQPSKTKRAPRDKTSHGTVAEVHRLIDRIATANIKASLQQQGSNPDAKVRIASIAAQQLHIYTVSQMELFAKRYWAFMRAFSELQATTTVRSKKTGEASEVSPASRSTRGVAAG